MKKITQLTFHCSLNYGAVLQTYALGKVLVGLGHSVKILDFRPYWIDPVWSGIRPRTWLVQAKFYYFWKKYLPPFTACIRDSSKLAAQCADADAVIVGSDQVWNPEITRSFADEYFLKSVPKPVSRISYAASFGISPDEWIKKFNVKRRVALLKKFNAVFMVEYFS